jgi:hypothetical protein
MDVPKKQPAKLSGNIEGKALGCQPKKFSLEIRWFDGR